ncbi:DNA polymerase III subunit alpha, partial [Lactobacillus paragasseri]|nr:DNA polymerase III subunit alpha [Lactobacillus paragasseri]
MDMARKLEGVTRNAGKHAGGVVIAPTKITDFAPLYCDEQGLHPVTQFDKNDVEYAGLVKFDLLGLGMLEALHHMMDLVEESTGRVVNLWELDLADPEVYDMLCRAD